MRRPLLLLLAVLCLAAPATAAAAPVMPPLPPPGYGVAIYRQAFDASGDPDVFAAVETPDATVTWHACAPTCGPAIGTDTTLRPGPTAPGTTFEVRATSSAGTVVARTAAWTGRVTAVTAPTVTGEVRIGRRLASAPAAWTGGWGDERDLVDFRACPTADGGAGCVSIANFPGYDTTSDVPVDPVYAGWFVGVVTQRSGPGFISGGIPYPTATFGSVGPRTPAPVGQTVAVGPLTGPVPPARAGTPPTVTGRLAAGARVAAAPGSWPDAPDDGLVATGLRACPTRHDTPRCRVLARANEQDVPEAGRGSRVLGPDLLGWYVGAFERHGRRNGGYRVFEPGSPELDALPVAGPSVVVGPLSTDPVRLGFTPRISVRSVAKRTATRLVLGRARCTTRCVVRTTVRSGGRSTTQRLVLHGNADLAVGRSGPHGGATRLRVSVRVDDATTRVARTVRVPRR